MADSATLPANPRVDLRELQALHAGAYSWALSRCSYQRDEADDLLQAAYARLLEGAARFDGRASLRSFLFGVIDNVAREQRRRRRWRAVLLARFSEDLQPRERADAAGDAAGDRERIWSALRAIAPRQRDVLELVFYRELTIEEAAAVMGVSVGTARTHYERGKRAMAARLAADRPGAGPADGIEP